MTQVLIDRATLEQALDAFETDDWAKKLTAAKNLRAALANAEPEPLDKSTSIDNFRKLISAATAAELDETRKVFAEILGLKMPAVVEEGDPVSDADAWYFAPGKQKEHP